MVVQPEFESFAVVNALMSAVQELQIEADWAEAEQRSAAERSWLMSSQDERRSKRTSAYPVQQLKWKSWRAEAGVKPKHQANFEAESAAETHSLSLSLPI